MSKIQRITPYLWFDNQAKEAAEFYCSIFSNSGIRSASPLLVEFTLDGMEFIALNGGPRFPFTEAISFLISCDGQEEVDYYWEKITGNGGEESMCAWCKDPFGLSWQVVPIQFMEMMKTGTPAQIGKVTEAMLKMRKMNVSELEKAFQS